MSSTRPAARARSIGLSALVIAIPLALPLGLIGAPVHADAPVSSSAALHESSSTQAATQVTVSLGRRTAPIGERVMLRGQVDGEVRTLSLQTRDSRGRWRTLRTGWSTASGAFAFATPTWHRTHPLRVLVHASEGASRAVSPVVKLRRTVPASTGGPASAWTPLDQRGVTRWDPCTAHTVRINTRYAPSWFAREVKRALADLNLYTGLDFTYAGTTRQRSPGPFGVWREADVVLAWSSARADDRLRGTRVAVGGSWFKGDRRADGFVLLDRQERLTRPQWRVVLRHELAHVLGLGHTGDTRQRMHPNSSLGSAASALDGRWGRGDIAGLKRIGAAHGCID